MVRGGGGGAGNGAAFAAQFFDMLASLLGMPAGDLARFLIGLVLMLIIIWMIRRLPAPRSRPVASPTTCILCGESLTSRTYVDRFLPNWAACGDCYDRLKPRQQRQYRLG